MGGQEFYERHRDDCVEWGIPAPPTWADLTRQQRIDWALSAADFIDMLSTDHKEVTP